MLKKSEVLKSGTGGFQNCMADTGNDHVILDISWATQPESKTKTRNSPILCLEYSQSSVTLEQVLANNSLEG